LESESGADDLRAVWKAHFPEFWPKGSRFAGARTGISPGDVPCPTSSSAQTMSALGKRLGVADPAVQWRSVCLDQCRLVK